MLNRKPLLLNCIRASLQGTLSQNDVRKLFGKAVNNPLTPFGKGDWGKLLKDAQISSPDPLLYYILKEENADGLLHFSTRLLWLYDIALLILKHGESLNWKLIEERARTLGVHRVVGLALDRVRQVLGVSVPRGAASWPESCRLNFMEKLLFVNGLGLVIWRYTLRLRLIESVRDKLELVIGQVFPSRDYIIRKYSVSSPRLVFFGYCHHLCFIFVRIARATFALTLKRILSDQT